MPMKYWWKKIFFTIALIEAAEKKEKAEIETMRLLEEKALKELEKKMKEEREDKMEYWVRFRIIK